MKTLMHGIAAAAVSLTLAGAANAGIETITFNGIAAPGSYVNFGSGPLTLSGVTFTSDGTMFVIDPGYYSSSYGGGGFLSADYAGSTDTLTIALPNATHFVSFDFGGLLGSPVTFNVAIPSIPFSTDISSTNSIVGTAALDSLSIYSSSAFDLVILTMPDSPYYNAIDNFSFGVPEPAAWTLMLIGFGAAGAVLRKRRTILA